MLFENSAGSGLPNPEVGLFTLENESIVQSFTRPQSFLVKRVKNES